LSKLSSECGGSDISLSRSYSDLSRRQVEVEYEQTLAKITQLQNELDNIEQKLMSVNTQDYVLLINEREELLIQLKRSSSIELDLQRKVCNTMYITVNGLGQTIDSVNNKKVIQLPEKCRENFKISHSKLSLYFRVVVSLSIRSLLNTMYT
jgi:hypothetical protein